MTDYEITKIKAQRAVLLEVAEEYPHRTIENIIQNMDARLKNEEKRRMRQ